jgi:hypothetical protein
VSNIRSKKVLATNEMLAKVHAMPKTHMTGKEFISV